MEEYQVKALLGLVAIILSFCVLFNMGKSDKEFRLGSFILFSLCLTLFLTGYLTYGNQLFASTSEGLPKSFLFITSRFSIILVLHFFILSFRLLWRITSVFAPSLLLFIFLPDGIGYELYGLSFKILMLPIISAIIVMLMPKVEKKTPSKEDETGEINERENIESLRNKRFMGALSFFILTINTSIFYMYFINNEIVFLPRFKEFSNIGSIIYKNPFLPLLLLPIIALFTIIDRFKGEKENSSKIKKWVKGLLTLPFLLVLTYMFIITSSSRIREYPEYASITHKFNLIEETSLKTNDGYVYSASVDGQLVIFIEKLSDNEITIKFRNKDENLDIDYVLVDYTIYSESVIYFYPNDYDTEYFYIISGEGDLFETTFISKERLSFDENHSFVVDGSNE
ncbi:hypothetical protein KQ51_01177 [Candidatus Izimaplasma bacterium HR1]|jgi:hypothetical protein|uniref:hypothetical protein n=1 Tax=Candidatus Izimoplasma sp. HR1 TaxID=1541959 RepID=UPI0004F7AEBD|nr:hypothetical protein KQ51_01177 [Candidatus Izimaplasma bacterium HR1]